MCFMNKSMKKIILLAIITVMSFLANAQKYELYVDAGVGANSCFIVSNIIRSLQVKPQMGYFISFDNNFEIKKSTLGFGVGFKEIRYNIYIPHYYDSDINYNILDFSLYYQKKVKMFYFKVGCDNNFLINNLTYDSDFSNNPYPLYTPSVFLESGISIKKFKVGVSVFANILPSYKLYFDYTISAIYLSNGAFIRIGYKLK